MELCVATLVDDGVGSAVTDVEDEEAVIYEAVTPVEFVHPEGIEPSVLPATKCIAAHCEVLKDHTRPQVNHCR